jgi:hypothetical protein
MLTAMASLVSVRRELGPGTYLGGRPCSRVWAAMAIRTRIRPPSRPPGQTNPTADGCETSPRVADATGIEGLRRADSRVYLGLASLVVGAKLGAIVGRHQAHGDY